MIKYYKLIEIKYNSYIKGYIIKESYISTDIIKILRKEITKEEYEKNKDKTIIEFKKLD